MQFEKKLRIFAEKFGSISALANALGIAQPSLSRYLSGEVRPGLDLIMKLKDLGCDINWLLSEDDKPPPETIELLKEENQKLKHQNEKLREAVSRLVALAQEDIIKDILKHHDSHTRRAAKWKRQKE